VITEQHQRPARYTLIWVLSATALIALLVIGYSVWAARMPTQAAGSVAENSQASDQTQANSDGQVTVKATWQGRAAGPVFTVALDTHAVALDGYDLQQLATLRVDGGQTVQPVAWDAPKGGHHRSGTLTFPATAADGSPLIRASTRTVELVIRDIAGVPERVLRWTIS